MNETQFHLLADNTLEHIEQSLEKADGEGLLEMEHEGGMVTIELKNGSQFIISKHTPTKQLWLSSPVSGGLHFGYDETAKNWRLADGRELVAVVMKELGL